ncbi:MAG: hypothetical protein ACYDD1_17985 [Caulobacteraceae bacterium]
MHKMIVSAVLATAVLGSLAGSGAATVQAAEPHLVVGVETVGAPAPVQQVQYFYGGRNYCWYGGGWHGPGYYWCGFAWRRGFGWGGPYGWRGWGPGWRGPGWHGPGWRGPGWRGHGWRRY